MAASQTRTDDRRNDDDETETIEIPAEAARDVEKLLKTRMARILPWAVKDSASAWADEYEKLARALRDVIEQKGQERWVRVLDMYPEPGSDRLWQEIGVDGSPKYRGGTIGWTEDDDR